MGTSIDVIFDRDVKTSEDIALGLAATFRECSPELVAIARNAWYAFHSYDWNLLPVPEHDGEPAYLFAEGPFGFGIHVYRNVVVLWSLERFGRLYDPTSSVARPLQTVIEAVVRTLTRRPVFAAVAEGMGDSDAAIDLAYYDAASFSAVCDSLRKWHGPPAKSWDELAGGDIPWCLIELAAPLPQPPAR
jgi:hypothetical protein